MEEILKALRPLRLKSVDQLDMNTRGRLLTTLLRVGRQPNPAAPAESPKKRQAKPEESSEASPEEEAASPAADGSPTGEDSSRMDERAESAPTSDAAAEAIPAEPAAAVSEASEEGQPGPASTTGSEEKVASSSGESPAAPSDGESPTPAAAAVKDAVSEKVLAYSEVMFLVGAVWRAVGDERRAAASFAASGRPADQEEAVRVLEKVGDWKEQAKLLETQGKTRDAARLHERNKSNKEAARLYEASGDVRSALRGALFEKDLAEARRLVAKLKPDEARPILEKARAYELLMEQYVQAGDFDNVARLYERARQFDQAALAWERAGKLANSRKAFERARDPLGADRIRSLEVAQLIKRGDRLGAASLLISSEKRDEAVKVLAALPGPKAFQFMQKLKLDAEAVSFARAEIAKAEQENRPAAKARWLEQLGESPAAAEAWEQAGRRDKALGLYEQAGDWEKAAQIAEATGQLDKAVELFHRAGDKESAERVAALPRPASPVLSAPPDDEPPAEMGSRN